MARLWSCGFELNSVTAEVELTSVTSATVSTTQKHGGSYALRVNPAAAIQKAFYQFATTGPTVSFYRAYIYIVSYPSAQVNVLYTGNDSDSLWSIRLNTSGTLGFYNQSAGGVQQGSNSSVLALNTWYRLEFSSNATTLASDVGVAYLNGSQFATGTVDHSAAGKAFYLNFGDAGSQTVEYYLDDVAVNDNTGSFQNGLAGEGKIIHVQPSAAGEVNGFLTGVGGTAGASNNYGRVNENTPDNATTYNGSALLNAEDLFECTNVTMGANDTVNVVAVGVRMADLVSADATASFKVEIEKQAGGTKTRSGTLIPNSTAWLSNASAVPRNHPLTTYQNPDGNNWTYSTLNSMQIGYIQDAVNVQTIAISTLWVLIDYTPESLESINRIGNYGRYLSVGDGMSRSEVAY